MGCKELDMTERLTLYLCCCYLVTKLCLILSTAWTSQARTLEWVAISSSRGPSQPRDWTHISCLADGFFTTEAPGKPYTYTYMGCKESDTTELLLHAHTHTYTQRSLLWRVGSWNYRGWAVPQSAVSRLKTQESQLVWFNLESEDLRTRSTKGRGRQASCIKFSGRKCQVFPLSFDPILGGCIDWLQRRQWHPTPLA